MWKLAPKELSLSLDEIHIWQASLNQTPSTFQLLTHTLSKDEQVRAMRFRFPLHRERFIIGRGILRAILALYVGVEPKHLQFSYGPYGKPALTETSGGNIFHFNMSHSHEFALYAITRGREIGIDIENVRPLSDAEQIVERFFSTREIAAFHALPESEKPRAFFTYWTCKEAYLKARGDGLTYPLNRFEVSLDTNTSTQLVTTDDEPQNISRWTLEQLTLNDDYAAAFVIAGDYTQLNCWRWLPS